MKDLFRPKVTEDKFHRNFKIVLENKSYSPAREMLNKIYNSVKAIDSHFIKEFQTSGFDSRIWELYLTAVFQEQSFELVRNHNRPDFELSKDGKTIFVEAVTSNPTDNQEILEKLEILKQIGDNRSAWEKFIYDLRDESTIKLAAALNNKLKKKYWELEWVKEKPLILAIEPFHHPLAHWLSDSNLLGYLYGIGHNWSYDESKSLQIETIQIDNHSSKGKTIPSNFFSIPEAKYISGILFSNSGTISKFNRMGKLSGYGDKSITMIRAGNFHDHNPNASLPIPFTYNVGVNGPQESWSQGIALYHNPNALYPVNTVQFSDILEGFFVNGEFFADVPDFHPYQSETHVFVPE